METVSRPAVRVLCFDADGRVLLLHWRDPHDGALLWEPPGGGIDPGETPLAAARRELYEETGLDPDAIRPPYRDVYRSSMWKGRRFAGDEQFFTAFYPGSRPAISKDNLLEYEVATLIEHRWVHPSELTALPGRLEPPHLAELVEQSRPTALVLPGIGGSGPGHWQTLLEAADPAAARFTPSSWDAPDLADWLAALDRAVGAAGPRPILVAHSLGALLVAHWAPRAAGRIGGALLVAVPDPAGPGFPAAAATFGPVPHAPLPFPSVLVGSTDDPYDPEALAPRLAAEWGSTYVSLDGAGHINADAGFGPFPLGARLLAELRDGRHAGH